MIPTLQQAANGQFYAHWTIDRRSNRRSLRTADAAVARERFARFLLEKGQLVLKAPTVAELWAVYDDKHVRVETASPETIGFAWRALAPHFGKLRPNQIDTGAVERYALARRPAKPGTIRRELAALRACLNWCVRRRMIAAADVPVIDLPKPGKPRDRWLKTSEIDRLVAAAEGPALLFIRIALETAARRQAILDLTWDRVDFETGVIHFNVPGRRETKKRRADVPISKALRPVLLAAARADGPVIESDIRAGFEAAVKRAGLRDVSPHVLRHTAATHMARRGVSLFHISKVLGNTIAMVESVYAKHSVSDLRGAVDAISGDRNEVPG